jgi:hypothetical protein
MFNKNQFKFQFSEWVADNPLASNAEAKRFCEEAIPEDKIRDLKWLVDQSVQWFAWAKSQKLADANFGLQPDSDIL